MASTLSELPRSWDVIVVGAGPAGGSAAIESARRGLQVLLVDAKRFPRSKACGGCLNQASLQLLQDLLDQRPLRWSSAEEISRFELIYRGRGNVFATPPGIAVDRAELDMQLANRAVKLGATFAAPATARLQDVDRDARVVELHDNQSSVAMRAKAVVVATGLGGGCGVKDLTLAPARNSRVGVDVIHDRFSANYDPGSIRMAVGRHGYVGLTRIGGDRLHIAAALDREAIRQCGPQQVVQEILRESGADPLQLDVDWRGTPPLTAKPRRLAMERVFAVGDAAGYVEPFTGEGIRWALESGSGVAPFVERAALHWQAAEVKSWERWHRRRVAARQQLCRRLSICLKHSTLRWVLNHSIQRFPFLARAVITRLNSKGKP